MDRLERGNRLQEIADALCHARRIGAAGVAAYNLTRRKNRSWRAASAVTLTYATDKADGMAARKAARLLDRPPTDAGKKLDQIVDKQAHALIAGSHGVDALIRGEWAFGLTILGNLVAQTVRDRIVNRKRDIAHHIAQITGTEIHVGSIPTSKRKMAVQAVSDVATQTPLANRPTGRFVLGSAHTAGTVLSIKSGAEILAQLNSGIEAALGTLPPDSPERQTYETAAAPTAAEHILLNTAKLLGHDPAGPSPLPAPVGTAL